VSIRLKILMATFVVAGMSLITFVISSNLAGEFYVSGDWWRLLLAILCLTFLSGSFIFPEPRR
jgi:hypothetical protein